MRGKMLVHIQFKLSVGLYLIITEKSAHKHPEMFGSLSSCERLTDGPNLVLCGVGTAARPHVIKSGLHFCHIS